MPNRSGKKPKGRDVNQMARAFLDRIEQIAEENPGKNPVRRPGAQGRAQGTGGRMDGMTAEERRKLTKAAKARWAK